MISVVMSYYERPKQLWITLETYRHWYTAWAGSYEVVIVDDDSPTPTEELREALRRDFPDIRIRLERFVREPGGVAKNPGRLYNYAVSELASYNKVFLTNPENAHLGPVLQVADDRLVPSGYLVFCTYTLGPVTSSRDLLSNPMQYVDRTQLDHGYYQHSRWMNRLLHFGSAIHRDDYLAMGGFHPAYDAGDAWEDNDFAELCVQTLNVEAIDAPALGHQHHPRHTPQRSAYLRNWQAFVNRWGRDPGVFVRTDLGWVSEPRR